MIIYKAVVGGLA